MSYFTNYNIVKKNGTVEERRSQACFSGLSINNEIDHIDVVIPIGTEEEIKKGTSCYSIYTNNRTTINKFIILLRKCGFKISKYKELDTICKCINCVKIKVDFKFVDDYDNKKYRSPCRLKLLLIF